MRGGMPVELPFEGGAEGTGDVRSGAGVPVRGARARSKLTRLGSAGVLPAVAGGALLLGQGGGAPPSCVGVGEGWAQRRPVPRRWASYWAF